MENAEAPATDLPPFERWLEAARPKARLWRAVIGAVIAIVVWIVWTTAVLLAYVFAFVDWSSARETNIAVNELLTGATPVVLGVMLLTFLGLWFGVWLALRLMHGQKFWAVVSPEKTIRWREFSIGVAIIAAYAAANTAITFAAGMPAAQRTGLSLIEWTAIAAPICVLIFFQASGEELFFRGYVTQQLGARFRNPLIWGLLPSLAFGLIHYSNGTSSEHSAYYVVATTLFGLIATVSVWRTGSLSMAMGMHTANNVLSFLLVGTSDSMNSTQLWLWTVDDVMRAAPYDMVLLALLLIFMLSPWAPLPKRQLFSFRKEMRAAP